MSYGKSADFCFLGVYMLSRDLLVADLPEGEASITVSMLATV